MVRFLSTKAALAILVPLFLFACQSSGGGNGGAGQANSRGAGGEAAGCVEGDCENGRGVYVYPTGDRYSGEFRAGKREGSGVFEYANGDRFAGLYSDDVRNGEGVYTHKNGDVYEGGFKNGIREGQGAYRFSDGAVFRGSFQADGDAGAGNLIQGEVNFDCELRSRSVLCAGKGEADRMIGEPQN